jgi:hypothetical protein
MSSSCGGRTLSLGLFISVIIAVSLLSGCGNNSSTSGSITPPSGSNNALLQGQYAFEFAGQNGAGFLTAAGSFTSDGKGNITAGLEDVNNGSGIQSLTFTGTYAIGSDRRGTAFINTSNGTATWDFTVVNSSHALLIRFDTFATASGSIDQQDSTAFSTAAIQGRYVFGLAGIGLNLSNIASAGAFTMDGLGGISTGVLDVNDGGALVANSAVTGTYSVASTGRGLASITSGFGTQNFVIYVVNAGDIKIVESDSLPVTSGEVLQQAAGPFSAAALNGNFAFTIGGQDNATLNALAVGGLFTSDGAGHLTSVTLDANDGGTVTQGVSLTGTYTVNAAGRGFASFGNIQLAFYPAANGTVELAEIDANGVSTGVAKPQSAGPFSNSSLSGSFAANLAGTNLVSTGSEEDITGQITSDAAGHLTGTLDVNNSGGISQSLGLSGGSYATSSIGRGTLQFNLSSSTFAMQTYQVDANTVLLLEVDGNRVMTGIMQK